MSITKQPGRRSMTSAGWYVHPGLSRPPSAMAPAPTSSTREPSGIHSAAMAARASHWVARLSNRAQRSVSVPPSSMRRSVRRARSSVGFGGVRKFMGANARVNPPFYRSRRSGRREDLVEVVEEFLRLVARGGQEGLDEAPVGLSGVAAQGGIGDEPVGAFEVLLCGGRAEVEVEIVLAREDRAHPLAHLRILAARRTLDDGRDRAGNAGLQALWALEHHRGLARGHRFLQREAARKRERIEEEVDRLRVEPGIDPTDEARAVGHALALEMRHDRAALRLAGPEKVQPGVALQQPAHGGVKLRGV